MFSIRVVRKWWHGPTDPAEDPGATGEVLDAAEYMASWAREFCPVKTGALRSSIRVASSMGGAVAHVVATADHAEPVEFGHMSRGGFVNPNPFMRPALNKAREKYPGLVGDAHVVEGSGPGGHLGVTFQA
jgi:hypothetical protein